jgi:outer membrane receptor protein involved in Fe transport
MNRGRCSARAHLLCGAAMSAVISMSGAAMAQEAEPIRIPAQSLATALNTFGVQTGRAVMFKPELAAGKFSGAVDSASDPELALNELLSGTGLSWRRQGDLFLIEKADADPQSGSAAGDGADGTVEALIVTAQKREEDIQDVPIAISAFTQEQLENSQVAGGPDLMTQVPNFTFTKTNFSSYSIQIRGIGTQAISATTDPAVAIAFNNTPFVRNRFFEQEFYDLQRVEVLRGPQGTLYGRNATAGVVNIISAKPSFGYEAKVSADVSNYNSTRVEGMINLPLVEDKVALRLAGAWTKRDGYVTNELTGNPIDGRDLWSTRLSLRFSPTDRIDANLIWEHFEEDDDRLRSGKQLCHKHIVTEVGGFPVTYTGGFPGSQSTRYQSQLSQGCTPASLYAPESFETPNGYQFGFYFPLSMVGLQIAPGAVDPYVSQTQSRDLRVIESTVDPQYMAKTDTVEIQLDIDLTDTLSLSSETAWATDFIWATQDYNRFNTKPGAWAQSDTGFVPRPGVLNNGVFCDPQIGCSDRLVSIDLSTARSRHFSQEFRLASNYDGPFNFSLGTNFLRYDTHEKYYVFINALSLFAAGNFASRIETPYVGGVSDNRECLPRGLEEVAVGAFGGVGTAGSCTYIETNPLHELEDIGHNYFLSKNPYKLISYAVFGEAYYQIADNVKLTAGLRWTVDKKEAPRIPSWVLQGWSIGYPVLEVVEQEWREPTGRLTLDWKPALTFTDETLLYASYAHGYKAGGANPPPAGVALNVRTGNGRPAPSATHPPTFEAEFVDAFELGAKNTFLDGRMTLNTAAFYYDYKGYQLSQIVDRSAITKNFDAEVWGLEIEADWRPLENLRLGLKLGYEDTKVADGMKAVDVMDRTAGNPDWIVVKPFPIYPSNCIVPVALFTGGGQIGYVQQLGNVAGSADGPCDMAYFRGLDIMTGQPYVANPVNNPVGSPFWSNGGHGGVYPNYPGFDPASAPNNGEGFDKDLSGNELPNAPHYTATLTADYTLPLPNDWLATLHTDLYYQSEAWTRIFNMEGYDKLKAYTNVNLAAIFTNEDAGWKVMAYVKNVFDRDSITGAFLNSDDTGLTTNVFLTEPRLYGLRVTKEWSGGPWWTGANPDHTGPFPLTVEMAGMVQKHDAPYETVEPSFMEAFSDNLDAVASTQHRDFDKGDGRQVRLTWRPRESPWTISGGLRYGRTNNDTTRVHTDEVGDAGCAFPDSMPYAIFCEPQYRDQQYYAGLYKYSTNWADITAKSREEHEIVDFRIGHDIGMGLIADRSNVGVELRYGQLNSRTAMTIDGIPAWNIEDGWILSGYGKYPSTHTRYQADLLAEREFSGVGPLLSWDAAKRLLGNEDVGHVDLDWVVAGGALFGKQKTSLTGTESIGEFSGRYSVDWGYMPTMIPTQIDRRRSRSVTVPVVDLSLGLSYEIQRIKVGAGYRWERYFDVLDVGDDEAKDADRTIDGPYFKIAVGFGG